MTENRTSDAVAESLAEVLFAGREDTDLAELFSREEFAYREVSTAREALRLSYDRLRLVHESVGPARELLADFEWLLALHEWSGIVDPTMASLLSPHYNLCLGTVLERSPNDPDVRPLLADLESMSAVGVFMMTELGYGTNAAALETEAVYDRDARVFRLTTPSERGQKFMPATGADDVGKIGVVMARLKVDGTDHGVLPFLVRLRHADGTPCEGVSITALPGKPAYHQDNALTAFSDVEVPLGCLLAGRAGALGEDGTFTSEVADPHRRFLLSGSRLYTGRLLLAAAAVACCRSATWIVVRYATQRRTFATGGDGQQVPVTAYRSFRRPVFTHLAYTYAMTMLVRHATRAYTGMTPEREAEVEHLMSLTKAWTTSWAERLFAECRERCGAQGMFSVNRIAEYLWMAHATMTAEGDNQVMLLKAAGEILSGLQHDPPRHEPEEPSGELLDEDFWAYVLREREIRMRDRINAELQRRANSSASFFDAWNGVTNQAVELARASAARIGLERLLDAVDAVEDARAAHALRRVAGLFALAEMDRQSGWLVSAELLTTDHVDQLPSVIDDLCEGIAGSVMSLVDAFRIPDGLVRAPIAVDDFVAEYRSRIGA